MVEVVADIPAAGCVKASYDVSADVRKPASLLNHERLIDDDAIVCTSPFDPVYAKPCDRSDSFVPFSVVDPSENSPCMNPIVVDVEL